MVFKIRKTKAEDIAGIYKFVCVLEEIIFDYKIFLSIFEENINNAAYDYLVALDENNSIIGFVSCHSQNLLHHCGRVAEVQELFVEENYRKFGVGRSLINTLEKILLHKHCILLEVTAQNKRLQTHVFYEQLGFKNTHKKFTKQLA